MNRLPICLLLILLLLSACSGDPRKTVEPPPLDPVLQNKLSTWLTDNGQPPADYVLGLFTEHDVVFLGEQHRVRHDPLLVQSLLPPLYEAGVSLLAYEFARREDQALVDSLLNHPIWDEELARRIIFQGSVWWGYREYVDVLKVAWRINSSAVPESPSGGRPAPDREPFRILALGHSPDWSVIKTQADRDDPEVQKKLWGDISEQLWAEVILRQVRTGSKVLAYLGMHHAFTEYRQPLVKDGRFNGFSTHRRCGNYVYEEIDKRAVTVYLHAPWNGTAGNSAPVIHPADGVIDALMLTQGPEPLGFDLMNGPLGELQITTGVYSHGYRPFLLKNFCDGWIYTKPISEYRGVQAIENWFTAENLAEAKRNSPNPWFRDKPLERFTSALAADAEIGRRWGHLR